MDKQELIDWYEKYAKGKVIPKTERDSKELQEILNLTSFLDNHYKKIKISQRIWHIINDKYELIRCKGCGKLMNWYRKYPGRCRNCENIYRSSQEYQREFEKIILTKYGKKCFLETEEYKEKVKKTNQEKYGVDWYSQSEDFKEKAKITNTKRYGVENYNYSLNICKRTINTFEKILKKDGYYDLGYRLISYKGNGSYEIYCPRCNKNFTISCNNNYRGRCKKYQEICTNCNPLQKHYSCGEKDVLDYVSSIYSGSVEENTKKIIYPYELDIYLPDLKLAIEYNGDYWHANPNLYSKDEIVNGKSASDIWEKDIEKINQCYSKDITLIVVWENDWINNREEIQSLILETINTLS